MGFVSFGYSFVDWSLSKKGWIRAIWLLCKGYGLVGMGHMIDLSLLLRGDCGRIVVSRGDTWWICEGVSAPLSICIAQAHTSTIIHMQDRLTTGYRHASRLAQAGARHVDSQPGLQGLQQNLHDLWASVGNMWTTIVDDCAWHPRHRGTVKWG